jgi:cytochrome c peroxidase
MNRSRIVVLALGFLLGAGSTYAYQAYSKPKVAQRGLAPVRPLGKPQYQPRAVTKSELSSYAPLPELYERRDLAVGWDEIRLGRQFFFDPRFSKNHDISCNSCHPLDKFGMDGRGVSIGHLGQTGRRNAPTVYNAAGNGSLFWDGRAPTIEEQAGMPVLDPFEMAMTKERVLTTLRSIPEYVNALKEIFPNEADPVTYQNFAYVIASFERRLVTPGRWDRYLGGDEQALTAEEKRGFMDFYQLGCPSCHAGRLVGGTHFEMLGQSRPWPNQTDLGRSELFGGRAQTPSFKVASLRNVEKTAPYFHDASSDTLDDAVRRMAKHQLGLELDDEKTQSVVVWLKTLTGDLPTDYIRKPELAPSTASTPKPERDGY